MKRALFTVLGGLLLALLPIRSIAQDYSSGKGLRAALKDKEAKVRTRAAEQLDGYDLKADPEMIAAVVDALKDVDEDVRRLAADALGKLRDTKEAKSYVPMLLEVASKDKSYKVRERAVNSLASFEGAAKGAVPGLIKALGDTDPDFRAGVVGALSQIDSGNKDVVQTFVARLKDADWHVRLHAVTGLHFARRNGADNKVIIRAMMKALNDEHPNVRGQAADELGYAGTAAVLAVPILEKMKKEDGDRIVRREAEEAIRRIRKAMEEQTTQ